MILNGGAPTGGADVPSGGGMGSRVAWRGL
jgi:hypothetical protein